MLFTEAQRARLEAAAKLGESTETGKWVVFLGSKKDPARWDSKGVMAFDNERRFYVFPDDSDLPAETASLKIVWRGPAKAQHGMPSSEIALRVAAKKYEPGTTEK